MATFIMTGKLSADSVKLISAERTVQANRIFQQCGGAILSGYATLGETDFLVVAELPGIAEAMKVSIELNKALGISFVTMPALPIDDFDKLVAGKP